MCAALLTMLCGCNKNAPAAGETVREHFGTLAHAETTVKILSNLGDSALEYQVDYEYNKEANDLLTVNEPESIRGVQLIISGDQADSFVLQYADTALDFQQDGTPGMSPADVLPTLFYDLANGEPTETGVDDIDGIHAVSLKYETMDSQPALAKTIWLRPDNFALMAAELYQDGEKKLTLFFQDYTENAENKDV